MTKPIAALLVALNVLVPAAGRADILYCAEGSGQVTIRSGALPAFTSPPDVRSAMVSQLIQQPASVRVDLTYGNRDHDSFVMVGDTFVQLHNLVRQPGDGQGRSCH